jgi:hypothetical protein
MPESRKADFYLGCYNGSVIIDFDLMTDNRIQLRRISFDGYGCCNLDDNAKYLDEHLSKEFIEQMTKNNIDQEKLNSIVLELIRLNKDKIWTDALNEYNLIETQ